MQAPVARRPVLIVLLNAQGSLARFGDANRIRQWTATHKDVLGFISILRPCKLILTRICIDATLKESSKGNAVKDKDL